MPRWTVPAGSGGAWLRVLACCPVPAAHGGSVWVTGPSAGRFPGALRARQMRLMAAVQAPSHHGCVQLFGLDGPIGVMAAG